MDSILISLFPGFQRSYQLLPLGISWLEGQSGSSEGHLEHPLGDDTFVRAIVDLAGLHKLELVGALTSTSPFSRGSDITEESSEPFPQLIQLFVFALGIILIIIKIKRRRLLLVLGEMSSQFLFVDGVFLHLKSYTLFLVSIILKTANDVNSNFCGNTYGEPSPNSSL